MSLGPDRFDAVIFDMDGLMLDTEPLYKLAWQQAGESCGHPIPDALYFELIGRTRTAGEAILQEAFRERFSLGAFRPACERCEAAVFAAQLPSKKPGLGAVLALLEQHRIRKAVATSTDRPRTETLLREHGVLDRFAALATGDEVASGKPHPEIYLLAARRLKVSPARCLVLEDSEAGVMAAHRAGMQVWIVPDLKQPTPEIEWLARGKFVTLTDVAEELRRRLMSETVSGLASTILT